MCLDNITPDTIDGNVEIVYGIEVPIDGEISWESLAEGEYTYNQGIDTSESDLYE